MSNMEKYLQTVAESLEITEKEAQTASASQLEQWDSIGHMTLTAALEEAFDIELEPEDILQITSFEKGIEVLRKNGVSL